MRSGFQAAFIAWRFYFLITFILLIVAGLTARLVDLTLLKKEFLRAQGDARSLRIVDTPAFRGMITDREGHPLAISTAVYSIWINPKEFSPSSDQLKKLGDLLQINQKNILAISQSAKNKKKQFAYLKRDISPESAQGIKKLSLKGVYQHLDYKRFYPQGEVAAHVVGFTNIDDQGQEGLELAYNPWLSGSPGKKIVNKDRLGRIISELQTVQEQKPGKDLALSVDQRIQYLAYRELLDGVKQNLANSGSAIVLDIKTGEILAMVNQPSFNPNKRTGNSTEVLRNRAVTDVLEPGSTIKPFTISAALASGLYKPETVINTYPGWIVVGSHTVRDEHRKGPMTLTQILQYSSNVGTTKIVLTLPPNSLWEVLNHVGFGQETGVNFPGERSGVLTKRDKWPPFALAALSWGYGISVTPLQLAHAYATLANDGIEIPLSLVKVDKAPEGKRVMNSQVTQEILKMLESVVAKGGTAKEASIRGYRIAGKTGTSRMLGPNGYDKHHHNSIFIGVAPASNPKVIVAIFIHDPQGKEYHGGQVAGPVFKKIMEGTLRILNIPPDDLATEAKGNLVIPETHML